jgi:hypothetical protein
MSRSARYKTLDYPAAAAKGGFAPGQLPPIYVFGSIRD